MPSYEVRTYEPLALDEPRPRYGRGTFAGFDATTGKDAIRQFTDALPEKAWYAWVDGGVHLAVECPEWYEHGRLYVLERKLESPGPGYFLSADGMPHGCD